MAERGKRKNLVGTVVKAKSAKTIGVRVERLVKHPVIGKYVKRNTVYKAHDEKGAAAIGDVVEIAECRPVSKTKSFRLVRVVRTSSPVEAE